MASCIFTRVDSRNTSTTQPKYASRLIKDTATSEIMLAWLDMGKSGGADPGSVRFARFNSTTRVASAEVSITGDYAFSNQTASIDMVRLTDGRLIVAWYSASTLSATGNATSVSESTDGGATWSAAFTIVDINKRMHSILTDGTNVWILCAVLGGSGTGGLGDVVSFKRTSVGVWAAGVNNYDSGGAGGTPGEWDRTFEQAHVSGFMQTALIGCIVGWRAVDATSNLRKLTCLKTTDGWATGLAGGSSVVDLQTFTANGAPGAINAVITAAGRIYLATHNPDNSNRIILYYSDNYGVTWTTIGSPTAYTNRLTALGINSDPTYDSFLCLDDIQNLIFGQASGSGINPGYQVAFRSTGDPTSLSAYVQVAECSYVPATDTVQTATAGRGIIIGETLERLIGMVRPAGTNYFTLEFIAAADAGVPVETEGESPVADSDAADNNLYLRNNLAEPGGDSAHLFPVAYFMDWDEGDTETGREVPIILAASPSMDPAIQDPTLIPGFTRVSDPGSWTTRGYVSDGTNIQTVHDPLQFRVITPQYLIDKEFNRNVARGVLIAWVLNGASEPTVTVWVDGKLNHVIRLYNTFGKKEERFFPLPTFNNVGSEIQYVIEDLSPFFFSIETMGVKLKPKGIRG